MPINPITQNDLGPSKIRPGTGKKSKEREKKSQLGGPAPYAPHDKSETSNKVIESSIQHGGKSLRSVCWGFRARL